MRSILIAVVGLGLAAGAAVAQSDKPMNNDKMSPGTTGAMQNPGPGVATDPQQVQAQQGNAGKASAGTVGAAPGADTKSQMPNGQK